MTYLKRIVQEIINKERIGTLAKRRMTCAGCGYTWIELVGLIVRKGQSSEDLHLRLGIDRNECVECGDDNIFEITFPDDPPFKTMLYTDIVRVASQTQQSSSERRT